MKTCETCRHWGRKDAPDSGPFRDCQAVKKDEGDYSRRHPGNEKVCPGEWEFWTRKPLAVVVNPDDLYGGTVLRTLRDFGCLLHEDK